MARWLQLLGSTSICPAMDTDPASLGEKFNRILPKNIREASAILAALILLAVDKWPGVAFTLLVGAFLSLFQRIFTERKPKPIFQPFFDEMWLASQLPADADYPKVALDQIDHVNEGVFHLRIDHKQRDSFFSNNFRYKKTVFGGLKSETEEVAIYATEIPPSSMYGRWWEGLLFRAGNYTTAEGNVFQWFTADPRKALEKHPLPKDYVPKALS